jgi:hypothetical protein
MYVMYLRRSEGSRRCGHHPHAIVAVSRSSSRSLGALRPDASFSQMKQPVRRAPVMARLDALAAGPATARSGRPYPCQALGRRRPARGSISTAERPWGRCAALRRRPGSTRWPQGPRRRGPEGRTRVRPSEGAGRLASSQVLQHVPRRSLSRRMRSRARRGTRREIHRYSRRVGTP